MTNGKVIAETFTPDATLKAQAEAWFDVCRALDIVHPEWMSLKPTLSESAVEAITRLGVGVIRIPCGAGKVDHQ